MLNKTLSLLFTGVAIIALGCKIQPYIIKDTNENSSMEADYEQYGISLTSQDKNSEKTTSDTDTQDNYTNTQLRTLSFYDIHGVELDNITIKIGNEIVPMESNKLILPTELSDSNDIVLITGKGSNMKQLLLGKVNVGENIDIIPEETNSIIRGYNIYINLDKDTIIKSDQENED